MAAQSDRIEQDVLIAAPIERVWDLVTDAEHVGRWFGDAGAEIDLRPGGALEVVWNENPTVHGRVEAVEAPRRFAYRWLTTAGPETWKKRWRFTTASPRPRQNGFSLCPPRIDS